MATAKKTAAAKTKPAAKKTAKPAAQKETKASPKKEAKPAKKEAKPAKKEAKPAKKEAKPAKKPVASAKAKPSGKVEAPARVVKKAPQPAVSKAVPEKKPAAPLRKNAAVEETKSVKKPQQVQPPVPAPAPTPAKKPAKKEEPVKPVKLPKITAQGKVPYEPDFTHSVLDSPKAEAPVTTPTQRYSDSDLAEFRELISRKLETARKELAYLQGLITRKDDAGGEGDDGRYMTMEDGTLSMEREQLSQMASRQITFIDHLEKALIRIENKTYGICRETGKLIDKARLRAVPHATLSVEAKMKKNR